MKKILFFILFTSYSLVADALPNSMKSTVANTSADIIELSNNVPAGMSGVVIHNYGNGLSAITHATVSLGNKKASIQPYTDILHPNIPSVQTTVTKGDNIIFGNFYQNALLIAPNQTAYSQITRKFKRTWTHPDAFALDFMEKGETYLSMEALERFSKKNQIGLVLVVTSDKLLIIDPLSKQVIRSTGLQTNPNTSETPFYARFEQMDLSVFGFSEKKYTPYFQSVAGLE